MKNEVENLINKIQSQIYIKGRRITIEQIAEKVGISREYLANLKRGIGDGKLIIPKLQMAFPDLKEPGGDMDERILQLEAAIIVQQQMLAELKAQATGAQSIIVMAEMSKAVQLQAEILQSKKGNKKG